MKHRNSHTDFSKKSRRAAGNRYRHDSKQGSVSTNSQFIQAKRSGTVHRKALQLCRQVQEALYWVLGSECGNENLALLNVQKVEPAPDTSRLLVTVEVPEDMSITEALSYLEEASKALRVEIAGAINRRRVPELLFNPVVAGSWSVGK